MIHAFIEVLSQELKALVGSAKAAHQAATHEESKAEDRHDTFAIEASYLAAGQATRVQELIQIRDELEGYLTRSPSSAQAAPGCLITVESEGESHTVLLGIRGGGFKVSLRGASIQILSVASPLGEELRGLRVGDLVEVEIRGSPKSFEILSID